MSKLVEVTVVVECPATWSEKRFERVGELVEDLDVEVEGIIPALLDRLAVSDEDASALRIYVK